MNGIRSIKNSFKKEKGFGLLNIIGLSVGMAMSLLIIWYLQYQTSFESDIPEVEKIYRLISKDKNNGNLSFGNPLPMAQTIREDYPGISQIVAISNTESLSVTVGDSKYNIDASAASGDIFSLLNIRLETGSAPEILEEPGSAVVSRTCAQKLFGNDNPVGKSFQADTYLGERTFTVRTIMNDPPVNSEFRAAMYLSWEYMNPQDWRKNWWWFGTHILVKAKTEAQKTDIEQKINTILARHEAPYINGRFDFQLIPLRESHFRPEIENKLVEAVSPQLLWVLAIVAGFIILIACINFINLAIGQSERNTKETGICKVLGASRSKLMLNFLFATLSKSVLAALLAGTLVFFLAPYFRELARIEAINPFSSPVIWLVLTGMVVVSGLLSGLYPAIIVSRPKPVTLLSNRKSVTSHPGLFRKILVTIQFSVATALIISVLFIFRQISFLKQHDLGFNKEGLIALDVSSLSNDLEVIRRKAAVLEQEISGEAIPNGIVSIGTEESLPGTGYRNAPTVFDPGTGEAYTAIAVGIDENYSDVLELPATEGRNFAKDRTSDHDGILINETLKHKLGWTSIENKQLALETKDSRVNVIGVFKDVNINSLVQSIPPMVYCYKGYSYPQYMVFRISPEKEGQARSLIRHEWKKIAGDKPVTVFSVTDRFDSMYGNEERLSKIIAAFCLIAVVLSCFGLLSHIALSVTYRTKEIGIRKVNGAKISEVMVILNKDFVKWVAIAFIIATPVAYYSMHKWLENFAYKTTLSWWIFALAGLLALGIALLTVSWQSWKAATRNPVDALRYE